MKNRIAIPLIAAGIVFLIICVESKTTDPYKVLGVDRKATDREIQKAFHKLSLQYHPDKNKNKGAQEKFAEINNAYEILSDEQKRKNYDLYGDEKGSPGFGAGDTRQNGGYSYFTSGGAGDNGFNFKPGGWQNMGGQGGSKSFSFSFGGPNSGGGFDMGDIFSNFFGGGGMGGGSQFGSFGRSGRSKPSSKQQSAKKDNSESDSKSWSRQSAKKDSSESDSIPLLTASNFNDICGDKVPVCLVGVFKSERTREKLQKILSSASQKSFSRRPRSASGSREQVSYALLDGSKQQSFLTALNKSELKSSDKLLLAYKPKRGTYAASHGEITEETVESFVSSILNGDVQFSKERQKPTLT